MLMLWITLSHQVYFDLDEGVLRALGFVLVSKRKIKNLMILYFYMMVFIKDRYIF